ncbi:MAG TPA: ABC transporter ATP-binding protein [Phycisphaerae bacterium]|nr:ABC transporter ATP-binding protein [Phycisphaerae bacterium]
MSDNGTPIVELRKVHKRFGPLKVLRGVDLKLPRGKTTVIIGESGTGKSVLLKLMVGLLRPDIGEVHVDGQRVDNLRERQWGPVRRRFGFLFQMGALFDSMTTGQNIGFPLREHTRLSDDEIDRAVAEKLHLVGLEGAQSKWPAELSGGQRKRVALARAIALSPDVVLYDEPTTGLDPIRADMINDLIIKLRAELGITSVVVTHDMTSAFKVADHIHMLHQGEVIASGMSDDFRESVDPRVRRFVTGDADLEITGEPADPDMQADGPASGPAGTGVSS